MISPRSKAMRLVVVESPYMGRADDWPWPLRSLVAWWRRQRNIRYARAAVRDSLIRGEAPIASHLLYTQPGILRDHVPHERGRGIAAGLDWGRLAEVSAFYVDLGVSPGMETGAARATREGRIVEFRSLPAWRKLWRKP